MTSGSDILKELFISLGWQYDEASAKKTVQGEQKVTKELERESKARETYAKKGRESLESTIKTLAKLTAVAEAMALGVTAAVERMARSFEAAYYASSRTGSSVKEMNAFKFAASQMGSSADEAQSAIEGLARAQREMPGYATILKKLGATDPNNLAKSLNDIAPRLAQMPLAQAEAYAKLLHIPENLLLAMRKVEEFRKFEAQNTAKYNILGFDPEKAAEDGKNLTRIFRNLYDTVEKIGESIGSKLFGDLKGPIADLNDYLLAHGKEIADTIASIAEALFKLLDGLVRMLPGINRFVIAIGGWNVALTALSGIVSVAFVGRIMGLLKGLSALSLLATPPGWVLSILGISAAASAGTPPAKQVETQNQSDQDNTNAADAGGTWGAVKGLWRKGKRALGFGGDSGREGFANRAFGKNDAPIANGTFTQKAPSIAQRLKADFGLTDEEAAAVLGNLGHESAGFKAFNEGGGGPGRGWAQWTDPGRKARFFAYAKENNLDPKSDEANYGFLRWELQNTHKGAIDALKKARGLEGKTVAFERVFEGAGIKAYGSRFKYAHAALRAIQNQPTKLPAMVTPRNAGDADWQTHRGGRVPMPVMTNPFGGLDPAKIRSQMNLGGGQPIGGSVSDSSKSVTIHQTNNNHVTGVSDPTAAAAQIGARHDKHSSTLVRNMQSAIA